MLKINEKRRKFLKYCAFLLLSIPFISILLKFNPLKNLFKEFKNQKEKIAFEYIEE